MSVYDIDCSIWHHQHALSLHRRRLSTHSTDSKPQRRERGSRSGGDRTRAQRSTRAAVIRDQMCRLYPVDIHVIGPRSPWLCVGMCPSSTGLTVRTRQVNASCTRTAHEYDDAVDLVEAVSSPCPPSLCLCGAGVLSVPPTRRAEVCGAPQSLCWFTYTDAPSIVASGRWHRQRICHLLPPIVHSSAHRRRRRECVT